MIDKEIKEDLFKLQDKKYRDFHSRIVPNINKKSIIGVRMNDIRSLAKKYINHKDVDKWLKKLPHQYFDENNLHVNIINQIKDYNRAVEEINRIIPYIDNWALSDVLNPKILRKHKKELLKEIDTWLESDLLYTKRVAINLLMGLYLDKGFDEQYMKRIAKIRSDEYYLNMVVAWYFATALAKQRDVAIKYIKNNKLDKWTHNKAIQKAIESYRISDKDKTYLRSLKIKQ